jgi:hypothetical protein
MGNDYLYKEYELCFNQLQYYDSRQVDLLNVSVTGALFALYKFLHGTNQLYFQCQMTVSVVVFVGSVLLFFAMVQNRLYFVFTARQINSIRGYLITNEVLGFTNMNRMYLDKDLPAVQIRSVHMLLLAGAAFLAGVFVASFVFALMRLTENYPASWWLSVVVFILVEVVLIQSAIRYLNSQGKLDADKAIAEQ